jgi:hypothetical protein
VIRPYADETGTSGRPGPKALVCEGGGSGAWVYVGKAGESIVDGSKPSKPLFDETLNKKKLLRYLQLHLRV